MQQLLHNFGLWNAWKDGVEYADFSSAMGLGDSCPNAPELWRLGWGAPVAELNSSTFPLGVFRTFTLLATSLGPAGCMIKIQPDWLGLSYARYVRSLYHQQMEGMKHMEPTACVMNIHFYARTCGCTCI
jgi:hypothetical protein